jgi:rSAM/selenodomain-associated transferase 1
MAKRGAWPKRRIIFARRLVIMAKSPVLGRVKQRLGREIGDVAALRFYRNSLAHSLQRLARDPRWRTILAVNPDHDAHAPISNVPTKTARLPQGAGDLGARMQRLLLRLPPGPVIIVGSDIPSLRPCHVAEAFKFLGTADAVFGRASDGGYWLVGLKRTPKVLRPFAGVRWSGPQALADTLANLGAKRVAFAATLRDVDNKTDLDQEGERAGRLIFQRQLATLIPPLIQT